MTPNQPPQEAGLSLLESNRSTLIALAKAFGTSPQEAENKIFREIANVEQWLMLKPELKNCKKESFLYAVKNAIMDGLTLSPNADLAYLIPGRVKTGTDPRTNADTYEWVVNYEPTANGMLSMARQSGRIYDHKRPVCTYDSVTGAVLTVTVEFLVPSYDKPRWDSVTFGPGHFDKWKKASAAKFSKAGANYSSFNGGIDPEFAGTKAIIHGLNKRGMNMNETQAVTAQSGAAPKTAEYLKPTEIEPEFTPHTEVSNQPPQNITDGGGSVLITTHELLTINPNDL